MSRSPRHTEESSCFQLPGIVLQKQAERLLFKNVNILNIEEEAKEEEGSDPQQQYYGSHPPHNSLSQRGAMMERYSDVDIMKRAQRREGDEEEYSEEMQRKGGRPPRYIPALLSRPPAVGSVAVTTLEAGSNTAKDSPRITGWGNNNGFEDGGHAGEGFSGGQHYHTSSSSFSRQQAENPPLFHHGPSSEKKRKNNGRRMGKDHQKRRGGSEEKAHASGEEGRRGKSIGVKVDNHISPLPGPPLIASGIGSMSKDTLIADLRLRVAAGANRVRSVKLETTVPFLHVGGEKCLEGHTAEGKESVPTKPELQVVKLGTEANGKADARTKATAGESATKDEVKDRNNTKGKRTGVAESSVVKEPPKQIKKTQAAAGKSHQSNAVNALVQSQLSDLVHLPYTLPTTTDASGDYSTPGGRKEGPAVMRGRPSSSDDDEEKEGVSCSVQNEREGIDCVSADDDASHPQYQRRRLKKRKHHKGKEEASGDQGEEKGTASPSSFVNLPPLLRQIFQKAEVKKQMKKEEEHERDVLSTEDQREESQKQGTACWPSFLTPVAGARKGEGEDLVSKNVIPAPSFSVSFRTRHSSKAAEDSRKKKRSEGKNSNVSSDEKQQQTNVKQSGIVAHKESERKAKRVDMVFHLNNDSDDNNAEKGQEDHVSSTENKNNNGDGAKGQSTPPVADDDEGSDLHQRALTQLRYKSNPSLNQRSFERCKKFQEKLKKISGLEKRKTIENRREKFLREVEESHARMQNKQWEEAVEAIKEAWLHDAHALPPMVRPLSPHLETEMTLSGRHRQEVKVLATPVLYRHRQQWAKQGSEIAAGRKRGVPALDRNRKGRHHNGDVDGNGGSCPLMSSCGGFEAISLEALQSMQSDPGFDESNELTNNDNDSKFARGERMGSTPPTRRRKQDNDLSPSSSSCSSSFSSGTEEKEEAELKSRPSDRPLQKGKHPAVVVETSLSEENRGAATTSMTREEEKNGDEEEKKQEEVEQEDPLLVMMKLKAMEIAKRKEEEQKRKQQMATSGNTTHPHKKEEQEKKEIPQQGAEKGNLKQNKETELAEKYQVAQEVNKEAEQNRKNADNNKQQSLLLNVQSHQEEQQENKTASEAILDKNIIAEVKKKGDESESTKERHLTPPTSSEAAHANVETTALTSQEKQEKSDNTEKKEEEESESVLLTLPAPSMIDLDIQRSIEQLRMNIALASTAFEENLKEPSGKGKEGSLSSKIGEESQLSNQKKEKENSDSQVSLRRSRDFKRLVLPARPKLADAIYAEEGDLYNNSFSTVSDFDAAQPTNHFPAMHRLFTNTELLQFFSVRRNLAQANDQTKDMWNLVCTGSSSSPSDHLANEVTEETENLQKPLLSPMEPGGVDVQKDEKTVHGDESTGHQSNGNAKVNNGEGGDFNDINNNTACRIEQLVEFSTVTSSDADTLANSSVLASNRPPPRQQRMQRQRRGGIFETLKSNVFPPMPRFPQLELEGCSKVAVIISLTYRQNPQLRGIDDEISCARIQLHDSKGAEENRNESEEQESACSTYANFSDGAARAMAHAFRQQGFFVFELIEPEVGTVARGRKKSIGKEKEMESPTMSRGTVLSVVRSALAHTHKGGICAVYVCGRGGCGALPTATEGSSFSKNTQSSSSSPEQRAQQSSTSNSNNNSNLLHFVYANDTNLLDLHRDNVIILEDIAALRTDTHVSPLVIGEVAQGRAKIKGAHDVIHSSYGVVLSNQTSSSSSSFGGNIKAYYDVTGKRQKDGRSKVLSEEKNPIQRVRGPHILTIMTLKALTTLYKKPTQAATAEMDQQLHSSMSNASISLASPKGPSSITASPSHRQGKEVVDGGICPRGHQKESSLTLNALVFFLREALSLPPISLGKEAVQCDAWSRTQLRREQLKRSAEAERRGENPDSVNVFSDDLAHAITPIFDETCVEMKKEREKSHRRTYCTVRAVVDIGYDVSANTRAAFVSEFERFLHDFLRVRSKKKEDQIKGVGTVSSPSSATTTEVHHQKNSTASSLDKDEEHSEFDLFNYMFDSASSSSSEDDGKGSTATTAGLKKGNSDTADTGIGKEEVSGGFASKQAPPPPLVKGKPHLSIKTKEEVSSPKASKPSTNTKGTVNSSFSPSNKSSPKNRFEARGEGEQDRKRKGRDTRKKPRVTAMHSTGKYVAHVDPDLFANDIFTEDVFLQDFRELCGAATAAMTAGRKDQIVPSSPKSTLSSHDGEGKNTSTSFTAQETKDSPLKESTITATTATEQNTQKEEGPIDITTKLFASDGGVLVDLNEYTTGSGTCAELKIMRSSSISGGTNEELFAQSNRSFGGSTENVNTIATRTTGTPLLRATAGRNSSVSDDSFTGKGAATTGAHTTCTAARRHKNTRRQVEEGRRVLMQNYYYGNCRRLRNKSQLAIFKLSEVVELTVECNSIHAANSVLLLWKLGNFFTYDASEFKVSNASRTSGIDSVSSSPSSPHSPSKGHNNALSQSSVIAFSHRIPFRIVSAELVEGSERLYCSVIVLQSLWRGRAVRHRMSPFLQICYRPLRAHYELEFSLHVEWLEKELKPLRMKAELGVIEYSFDALYAELREMEHEEFGVILTRWSYRLWDFCLHQKKLLLFNVQIQRLLMKENFHRCRLCLKGGGLDIGNFFATMRKLHQIQCKEVSARMTLDAEEKGARSKIYHSRILSKPKR